MTFHSGFQPSRAPFYYFGLALICTLALSYGHATAASITITCPREDVIVQGWDGPLFVTYEGEATGTLKAKSATLEFSLPAKMEKRSQDIDGKQQTVTTIRGFDKTSSKMPELAALEACIAKSIDPAQAQDKDSYLTARDGCLAKTPLTKEPVEITAFLNIGVFPGDPPEEFAPIVEMQRTYAAKTAAPGGSTVIETFPAQCTVAGN